MWQFSSHPWPESQTLGPCATLQPPMGTAGHCLRPSGSSRLCSLPSRFKTLQRCFAETKTSGLQGSYFHLPTAQPPAIELRKQEKSVFPSVSLCCFADCSEVEAGLCPSSGGFLGYITASELLAEESPGSTEVQPGGEGAQDVLYLLMPQP